MKRGLLSSFAAGLICAVGLCLSGMTDPGKVLLIAGSALFGVGWGLVGYCPGPVVTSLPAGALPTVTFAGAMVVGFILYNRFEPAAVRPNASRTPAPSQPAATESLS